MKMKFLQDLLGNGLSVINERTRSELLFVVSYDIYLEENPGDSHFEPHTLKVDMYLHICR